MYIYICILSPAKYYARWPVTVSYFPSIRMVFDLLADKVQFVFGIHSVFFLFTYFFHFL